MAHLEEQVNAPGVSSSRDSLAKLSGVCDPEQPSQVSVRLRHGIGLGQGFEVIEARACGCQGCGSAGAGGDCWPTPRDPSKAEAQQAV
jgi:hypothetical protein